MFLPELPPRTITRLVERDQYPDLRSSTRRQATPAAIERREPRPDPLGVVLARRLNGSLLAAGTAWLARIISARHSDQSVSRGSLHVHDQEPSLGMPSRGLGGE